MIVAVVTANFFRVVPMSSLSLGFMFCAGIIYNNKYYLWQELFIISQPDVGHSSFLLAGEVCRYNFLYI